MLHGGQRHIWETAVRLTEGVVCFHCVGSQSISSVKASVLPELDACVSIAVIRCADISFSVV
jgi:hypothetical protein